MLIQYVRGLYKVVTTRRQVLGAILEVGFMEQILFLFPCPNEKMKA
jgi:hypothetical protein